jgi:hypothetical protein
MAKVFIAFHTPLAGLAQVVGQPNASESITSSATSQQTTATAKNGEVATITVSGGDIRAQFGANPTATANSWLIVDGTTRDFAIAPGDKVAVVDD